MNRFLFALILLMGLSLAVHADCQPGKDSRKSANQAAGTGVEVVDIILSGASTVDTAVLESISKEMIGACFDDQHGAETSLTGLFRSAGYLSVQIDDLHVQELSDEITPTPVQLRGNVVEGQRYPSDIRSAYQFLLDHRSDSIDVDPAYVDSTIAELSLKGRFADDRDFYIKALANLLDFERRDEYPEFSHHFVQYPASEALLFSAAVPYLIDAIKQSDSELVRKNAVDALLWMGTSRGCMHATVSRLNQEAQRAVITPDQKTRLQMTAEYAAEYINDLNAGRPDSCRSANGKPSTEKQVWKELERESTQWEGHEMPQPR